MTVIVTSPVPLPPALIAVTVYVVGVVILVGVHEISPVAVSKIKPGDSVGEVALSVTAPPFAVGVTGVIAVPLVYVNGLRVFDVLRCCITYDDSNRCCACSSSVSSCYGVSCISSNCCWCF